MLSVFNKDKGYYKAHINMFLCVQCKQAFHVKCFTLYHFHDALNSHHAALVRLIRGNDGSRIIKREEEEKVR
jgi:hypothetical protein